MADAGKIMVTCEGDYDPERLYDRLCLVNSDDGSYLSKKPVQGIKPTEGEFWQKFDIKMATDNEFSETSINPVQNRVITAKINEMDENIGTNADNIATNAENIETISGEIESLNTDLALKANASDLDSKANKADVDDLDYLKSVVKEHNCGNVPAGGTLTIPKSLWGGSASPYLFFLKTSSYGGNYNNLSALITYQYSNKYEYSFNVISKTDKMDKFTISLDSETGNILVKSNDSSTPSPNIKLIAIQ